MRETIIFDVLPNELVWGLCARKDPSMPPRRDPRVAYRWAFAVAHACDYIRLACRTDESFEQLQRWALHQQLTTSTLICRPPGYTPVTSCIEEEHRERMGTLDREANDRGGIEGIVIRSIINRITHGPPIKGGGGLGRLVWFDTNKWRIWSELYPETARLADSTIPVRQRAKVAAEAWEKAWNQYAGVSEPEQEAKPDDSPVASEEKAAEGPVVVSNNLPMKIEDASHPCIEEFVNRLYGAPDASPVE